MMSFAVGRMVYDVENIPVIFIILYPIEHVIGLIDIGDAKREQG